MDRTRLHRFVIGMFAPSLLFICAGALADDRSFAVISKAIEKSVTSLGYPQSTATDLLRLVRNWNCEQWNQKLLQASSASSPGQAALIARVEEEAVRWLYQTLEKEISPARSDSKYYNLAEVVKDKKAQCVGYSKIFWVLSNAIGLTVRPIDVLAPANNARVAHVSCMVSLADGNTMMVDLSRRLISRPFDFKATFAADGNYWLRTRETGVEIHRRIQILDGNGLASCAYCNVGVKYSSAKNHKMAISCFTKASELAPKRPDAYICRGNEYYWLNRFEDALSNYNKAIELDPQRPLALQVRGSLFALLGRSNDAISDFSNSILYDPKYPESYYGRGVEYESQERHLEAIRDFTTVIDLDSKDYRAYYARAGVYNALKQFAEAIKDLDRAIELNPKSIESYCLRGNTYGEMRQFDEALSNYSKAIEIDPNYATAYTNRGIVYAHMSKTEQARADFQKAAQLDPATKQQIKVLADKFKLGL